MKLPYDCRGMPAYETEVDGWTVGPVLSKLHMSDEGLYDRMLSTARGSPTAAIVVDGEGRIIALNEAWTALCGYSPNEALHQSPKILQGDATDAAKARRFSDEVRECGAARTILANYSKGGDPFAHQLRSTKVCSRQGDSTYYFTESEAVADKAIERAVLDGEVYRCALLLDVQTRLSDTPPPPGPTLFQAERRVGRLRRARSHYPHSLPPRPRPPRLAGGRRLDRDFRHARRHHRPRCGRRPPAGRARGGQHRAAPGGPRVRRGRVRLARPRRRALEGGPPPCRVLIGCPCRWRCARSKK